MLRIVKTLFAGVRAGAAETMTDHFAVDLLAQKIRESETGLVAAKETLATLILRQRGETRALDQVTVRIADLEDRTRAALAAGSDGLAREAAEAIAELENEAATRRRTLAMLTERIGRMRLSVEKTHRRIVDLKQGMIQARAIDSVRKAERGIGRTIGAPAAMREAEELLVRIAGRDDPAEEAAILDEIDAGLSGAGVRERLAEAGFGPAARIRAEDVLARLRGSA